MREQIVTRAEWGFTGWARDQDGSVMQPAQVPLSERTEYYIHYDGAAHINITGNAVPERIDEEHKGNGWAGIGYHFVVDQAGNIFEGRGWDLQGAHCPNHNRSAIGVQIAIGGDQQPTAAALSAAVDLYDEACRRTGRQLAKHGHKDGFNTDCPGGVLYPWVQAGMPRPDNQEDDMPLTDADVAKILDTKLGRQYVRNGFEPSVRDAINGGAWSDADVEALAKKVDTLTATVNGLATGGGVTDAQLQAAAQAGAQAALAQLATALTPKGN